ncbi:MAG: amidohydrolase [Ruegeria sp.]|nr:amidohydrolase [Ruegeria sp.]
MTYADRIFFNGTVLTVDGQNSEAEAVATSKGRILAVGRRADVENLSDGRTEMVDLAGQTMLPGLFDAHGHFPWWGQKKLFEVNLSSPPLGEVTCIDQMIASLKAKLADLEAEDWVVGTGYELDLLKEKRNPTRWDLDKVATDRPVIAFHVSMHVIVANSYALEMAGITRDTPDPEGGSIGRDHNGEPDGLLEEFTATDLVLNLRPALTREQQLRGLDLTVAENLRLGITTTQDGWARFSHLDVLDEAIQSGRLKNRVVIWLDWRDHLQMLDGARSLNTHDSELLIPGAAKLFQDGSIPGYTGYLSKPYHTPRDENVEYRGFPVHESGELAKAVTDLQARGQQIAIHGNGDAAIDDILDAFEAADKHTSRRDLRHVVVHAQTARTDQLERMKALGLVPSFYIMHTYYWGDRHRDIYLGPERAMNISPAGEALKMGIPFTLHCDAPVVPVDPALMMWAAVNRKDLSGDVIGAHQRISAQQALRATTIDAAYQSHIEKDLGSIEMGKIADFAIVKENPLKDPDAIREMVVTETILGGETVYKS